jgi:hypothetical protein
MGGWQLCICSGVNSCSAPLIVKPRAYQDQVSPVVAVHAKKKERVGRSLLAPMSAEVQLLVALAHADDRCYVNTMETFSKTRIGKLLSISY